MAALHRAVELLLTLKATLCLADGIVGDRGLRFPRDGLKEWITEHTYAARRDR